VGAKRPRVSPMAGTDRAIGKTSCASLTGRGGGTHPHRARPIRLGRGGRWFAGNRAAGVTPAAGCSERSLACHLGTVSSAVHRRTGAGVWWPGPITASARGLCHLTPPVGWPDSGNQNLLLVQVFSFWGVAVLLPSPPPRSRPAPKLFSPQARRATLGPFLDEAVLLPRRTAKSSYLSLFGHNPGSTGGASSLLNPPAPGLPGQGTTSPTGRACLTKTSSPHVRAPKVGDSLRQGPIPLPCPSAGLRGWSASARFPRPATDLPPGGLETPPAIGSPPVIPLPGKSPPGGNRDRLKP